MNPEGEDEMRKCLRRFSASQCKERLFKELILKKIKTVVILKCLPNWARWLAY